MEHIKLKNTDLKLSRLALGTDVYGKEVPEEQAFKLLYEYIELGGNMIDTAHVYADWLPGEKHSSEKTIGKWLKESGKRQNLIIATKGAHPKLDSMDISRLSYAEIESDIDESLECLGTDVIDLYWLHRDDAGKPAAEIIESLNKMVKKGKIRYFGCSNWRVQRIEESNKYAEKAGLMGFSASQIKWSLAVTTPGAVEDKTLVEMDAEEYNWYEAHKFPVIPFSSQAKGFFTKLKKLYDEGKIQLDNNGFPIEVFGQDEISKPGGKANRYYNEKNLKTFAGLLNEEKRTGTTITSLALKYLTEQPFQVIPIIGCKTDKQLRESMAAF
ncbi:MAG: aldo/keto reductase [Clostridiales bacterium]|jgi:aryl-alcohol dehydrogenase-like predicted oxidoreductase|nr:aldo/keto reductase [Clostridiales bacterium]